MGDLTGIKGGDEYVVQNYISNPYLIQKKKWDLRVYVMIHGISPMRAYICKHGIS
jgi:hypothetical protein